MSHHLPYFSVAIYFDDHMVNTQTRMKWHNSCAYGQDGVIETSFTLCLKQKQQQNKEQQLEWNSLQDTRGQAIKDGHTWEKRNKSPTISPAYCIKTVSRTRCKEETQVKYSKFPKLRRQNWGSTENKAAKNLQGKITERRKLHKRI